MLLVKFGLFVARNRFPVREVATTLPKLRFISSTPQNRCSSRNGEGIKSNRKMESKEELRARLTPLQYQITQEAGTERPYSGCYNKHYEKGIYRCIVCHQDLFSSDTKYDSGCGWPAFNDVLDSGKVTLHKDASIPGMLRTEVRCSKCSAHMGHVFDDGPRPKGLRYCINSASLDFVSAEKRIRTEVRCAKCGAHMGHVFGDGPKPTGKRYCINSASLEFVSAEELNSALKS